MGRKYPTIATAVTAMIAQACGLVTANDKPSVDDTSLSGNAGRSGGGATGGSGGTSGSGDAMIGGFAGGTEMPNCSTSDLLADQAITNIGAQRVFYSWTTQEQVDELRAGGELFSRSERPERGRGQLFTTLAAIAQNADLTTAKLADVLANQVFAKQRYAWPNPWATVLGFPGETYGNELLEIELEDDAWIAVVMPHGELSVRDVNDLTVSLEDALQQPERIGAIFHLAPGDETSGYCGTFSIGAVGYREFVLGNLQAVKRWSLATPEITERLQSDIEVLKAVARELACVSVPSDWSSAIVCEWGDSFPSGGTGSLRNYDLSLALPNELYRPSPENLEALIAAMEVSLPTGEPLIVTPEK